LDITKLDTTQKAKFSKIEDNLPEHGYVFVKITVSSIRSNSTDQELGTLVYGNTIIYDAGNEDQLANPLLNLTEDVPAFTFWPAQLAEEIRIRDLKAMLFDRYKQHRYSHSKMAKLLLESDGSDVKVLLGLDDTKTEIVGRTNIIFFESGLSLMAKRLGASSLPFVDHLSSITVYLDNSVRRLV
jgi:hypothetical protein